MDIGPSWLLAVDRTQEPLDHLPAVTAAPEIEVKIEVAEIVAEHFRVRRVHGLQVSSVQVQGKWEQAKVGG